jgi:hypothetical protein
MQLLLSVFSNSFVIWARNFSLVYVILLGMLLIGFVTPREIGAGTDTQLLLMLGSLILLMAAFMAGWFNMIAAACRRYFERAPGEKGTPRQDFMENLSLFKYFLSGVSLHFLSVALNFVISGVILFLLSFSLQGILPKVLPVFQRLLQSDISDPAQQLLSLPAEERVLVEQFSFTVFRLVLLFAVFSLLTALWPAYVTQFGDNIFKAYWHSLRRFFKDPFRFLFIAGLFVVSQLLFPLVSAAFSGNIILGTLAQLSGLLFNIYMMIVLFVYALQTSNRPLCIQEAEGEQSDKTDSDDQDSQPPESHDPPSSL